MNDQKYFPQNCYNYTSNLCINYEIFGEGEELVVFLHGFGASLYVWDDIKNLFDKTKYKLILIDLKGYGFSSKPKDGRYSIEDQKEIIIDFLEYLNLDSFVLVGHSYGGGVALLTTIDLIKNNQDHKIKKLVLIDSAAYKADLPFFIDILRVPIINDLALNLLNPNYFIEYLLKHQYYDESIVTEKMVNRYARFFEEEGYRYVLKESAKQIIPDNSNQLRKEYKDIKIPTLIIWGKADPVIPISIGMQLNKDIPNSRMEVINNCGHVPHEELPNQTYNIITEFIE
jgi:pimeloyl-ACP methyl ester carboxylesterase